MPCYDPRPAQEAEKNYKSLQRMTPLLCEAVAVLRLNGLFGNMSEDFRRWAEEHDEVDREREGSK